MLSEDTRALYPKKARINKWLVLCLILILVSLSGLIIYKKFFEQSITHALQKPAKASTLPQHPPHEAQTGAHAPVKAPDNQMSTPMSAPHRALNSPSTLGDLTRMRAQRQLLEQQVKIRELQKKLDELNAPPVIAHKEIDLPALTPPAKPKNSEPMAVPVPIKNHGPVVVSVQGSGGRLSATIRTSDGRMVTVNNGASFGGGILSVSRQGVGVRRNGKLNNIPFE